MVALGLQLLQTVLQSWIMSAIAVHLLYTRLSNTEHLITLKKIDFK